MYISPLPALHVAEIGPNRRGAQLPAFRSHYEKKTQRAHAKLIIPQPAHPYHSSAHKKSQYEYAFSVLLEQVVVRLVIVVSAPDSR
jgi:hypothetical protein